MELQTRRSTCSCQRCTMELRQCYQDYHRGKYQYYQSLRQAQQQRSRCVFDPPTLRESHSGRLCNGCQLYLVLLQKYLWKRTGILWLCHRRGCTPSHRWGKRQSHILEDCLVVENTLSVRSSHALGQFWVGSVILSDAARVQPGPQGITTCIFKVGMTMSWRFPRISPEIWVLVISLSSMEAQDMMSPSSSWAGYVRRRSCCSWATAGWAVRARLPRASRVIYEHKDCHLWFLQLSIRILIDCCGYCNASRPQ